MGETQHVPGRIDLNADVGEEMGDDELLLEVVTSANVACGAHAGSASVMSRVCEWAVERAVSIGAHVSYDDREHFGRVPRDVPPGVLHQQVAEQVGLLAEAAARAGGRVAYLKPHGALYHRVAVDEEQAGAVLEGSGDLPVLGMPGALVLAMAHAAGRSSALEGFPDRGVAPGGGLLPRGTPGAVLSDPEDVTRQALALAAEVDSLCLHGDTPGALGHAHAVRRGLEAAGWVVRSHF